MPPQHMIRNQSEGVVNSNIKLLREQNQFFDVSLVCEDGARLPAHKIILAAHSDKFKQILEQMSPVTPALAAVAHCVYLIGLKGRELTSILDYIYEGEARVSQADLARFLTVAELLHINSLVNIDNLDASNVSQKPQEEEIEEEVYLASKDQNVMVEHVMATEDKELRLTSINPEVGENTKSRPPSTTVTDVNQVLLENLKVLGMSKLSKEIISVLSYLLR